MEKPLTTKDHRIVIFGAGKIGRSFIGQVFGTYGYEVVFVDRDRALVDELNSRNQYPVMVKGVDFEERIIVERVRAIHAKDQNRVVSAVADASILAISVGKNALPAVAGVVAKGLEAREKLYPGRTLDVILAENMRSADLFFREKLRAALPSSFPLDKQVGLVETSIGKMVPIMTKRDLDEDLLQVFAEPYNTLILDRRGFRGAIPDIPELALKENMKAWVDRKAFIHNLGHATAAYCGHLENPDAVYMYEVLDDQKICSFTRKVMKESAEILMAEYPDEFKKEDLSDHIEDLLSRFRNRNLGDTVFRVGCDLPRKLGPDDRFMGVIRLAQKHKKPYGMIIKAMAMGFRFKATYENGDLFPEDADFIAHWEEDPELVIREVCGLAIPEDEIIINALIQNL